MKTILIRFFRGYKKYISPLFIKSCRYEPTCSEFAAEAIEKCGTIKGLFLAAGRILRCNPFSPGGWDPVEKHIKKR